MLIKDPYGQFTQKGKQNSLQHEKMLNLTHNKEGANNYTGILFCTCQNSKNPKVWHTLDWQDCEETGPFIYCL